MAAKAKKANGRPRQTMIPGSEPEQVKEVSDAAEEFLDARALEKQYHEEKVKAADTLLALMVKHHLDAYETGSHIITISTLRKCKAKRKKENDADED